MTEDEIEAEVDHRVNREVERKLRPLNWALSILASVFTVAHFFVLAFVIPRFKEMFDEMDVGELPAPTLIVLSLSHAAVHYWWIAIPICIGGMITIIVARQRVVLMVLIAVLPAAFAFDVMAMFMPIITIMDKLSAGGGK